MDLLYLSTFATIVCTLLVLTLKYLSLLRWISGQAYVFSKSQEKFTSEEVLDLLKNTKPFPISCQKGWKIHCFAHGHRVWFNFLTIPHYTDTTTIKVFSAFNKLRASSQSILQLLRDISLTCEWKPGVIASSYVHDVITHDFQAKSKGIESAPIKHDVVTEERVCRHPTWSFDAWWQSNITQTTTEEYKRYWHREDNGCCWFLQMNEKCQSWVFFLAQPVEEVDQSLVTVATWNGGQGNGDATEIASTALSSLQEYISLRKLQATPLQTISIPQESIPDDDNIPLKSEETQDTKRQPTKLLSKFKTFIERTSQGNITSKLEVKKEELKKYSNILRFRTSTPVKGDGSDEAHSCNSSTNTRENESQEDKTSNKKEDDEVKKSVSMPVNEKTEKEFGKKPLQRSVSDTAALQRSARKRIVAGVPEPVIESQKESTDPTFVKYKTEANQAAAELLAQALKASNIELDRTPEEQMETSGGWIFYGFESDIVVLKKIFKNGSSVQSYLGKGLVQAPPKTVWDAVRNPRTRFTYDESLKKVDILDSVNENIKIIYLYHEILQLLKKETCDICMLQNERVEGEKYVLAYKSVVSSSAPSREGTVRAKVMPSGWIIEPVKKDGKVFSMVTYLMQLDFGPPRPHSDRYPFEEMVSKQPLSIAFLQQYLRPAVMLARRQSAPTINTS